MYNHQLYCIQYTPCHPHRMICPLPSFLLFKSTHCWNPEFVLSRAGLHQHLLNCYVASYTYCTSWAKTVRTELSEENCSHINNHAPSSWAAGWTLITSDVNKTVSNKQAKRDRLLQTCWEVQSPVKSWPSELSSRHERPITSSHLPAHLNHALTLGNVTPLAGRFEVAAPSTVRTWHCIPNFTGSLWPLNWQEVKQN